MDKLSCNSYDNLEKYLYLSQLGMSMGGIESSLCSSRGVPNPTRL